MNQVECSSGEVLSIVIDTLGAMLERTNESLKKLKLTKHCAAFQMTAIKGSVSILNSHLRRDDFKKGLKRKKVLTRAIQKVVCMTM